MKRLHIGINGYAWGIRFKLTVVSVSNIPTKYEEAILWLCLQVEGKRVGGWTVGGTTFATLE